MSHLKVGNPSTHRYMALGSSGMLVLEWWLVVCSHRREKSSPTLPPWFLNFTHILMGSIQKCNLVPLQAAGDQSSPSFTQVILATTSADPGLQGNTSAPRLLVFFSLALKPWQLESCFPRTSENSALTRYWNRLAYLLLQLWLEASKIKIWMSFLKKRKKRKPATSL